MTRSGQQFSHPRTRFGYTIGDHVVADNDCYIEEPGNVIGFRRNLFGQPRVVVMFDNGGEAVFYPHELRPRTVGPR